MRWFMSCLVLLSLAPTAAADGNPLVLQGEMLHIRASDPREWAEFPEEAKLRRLELTFNAQANAQPWTLQLRQQDVKQNWRVTLNDTALGSLVRDENDLLHYLEVPAGTLAAGTNRLVIEQQGRGALQADDIRLGEIALIARPRSEVLGEATLAIEVFELPIDSDQSAVPLPARLTILREGGPLQSLGTESNDHLAVRPGTVFTSTGKAQLQLPAGRYTLHAGRGFEYSLDTQTVTLAAGRTQKCRLTIRREVPTPGYVACDTHVHTLTYSRHGDATATERMITLAAEAIELPIATDHNIYVDHEPLARQLGVRQYFTPVVGNEVTTRVGHFNIFPAAPDAQLPDHRLEDWAAIFDSIYSVPGVKVAILNHPRDLHSGTRPFNPALYNEAVGENIAGWHWGANAMEVINSSATQSEPTRLFHDYLTLLNRGRRITPVGCSDSHDVSRHFVGQARTYIRCDDRDVGQLDVEAAINNFVQGRVLVSYGLLAEIEVADQYGPGEVATVPGDEIEVQVCVKGPHWTKATHVALYANGEKVQEVTIEPGDSSNLPPGVKWQGRWKLPKPKHDIHLVALATGPGITGLYWRSNKPYQPTSPHFEPLSMAATGAVWIDADGDGRPTAAYDYAQRLVQQSNDLPELLERLATYDAATAAQAAHLYQATGRSLLRPEALNDISLAAPAVREGFHRYLAAWRETQQAKAAP